MHSSDCGRLMDQSQMPSFRCPGPLPKGNLLMQYLYTTARMVLEPTATNCPDPEPTTQARISSSLLRYQGLSIVQYLCPTQPTMLFFEINISLKISYDTPCRSTLSGLSPLLPKFMAPQASTKDHQRPKWARRSKWQDNIFRTFFNSITSFMKLLDWKHNRVIGLSFCAFPILQTFADLNGWNPGQRIDRLPAGTRCRWTPVIELWTTEDPLLPCKRRILLAIVNNC